MKIKFKSSFLLILSCLFLASCGDVLMKKSQDDDISLEQFAICTPDPKALAGIFTANVRSDLVCLEENLNLFIEVVKTDRPGNLSLKELKLYIKKNVNDLDPSVIEVLNGIFNINSLILGDDSNYINKKNVRKLIQLLIDINKVLVNNKVFYYFTDADAANNYSEHNTRKSKVFNALTYVSKRIQEEFKDNANVLNLVMFLNTLKNLGDNKVLQNSTDLLFFKKMFVGGDEEVLTSNELKRLAGMLPDIGKVVYDLIHINDLKKSGDQAQEILLAIEEDAATIVKNLYYKGQDYVNVMSIDNIWDTIAIFTPEYLKYKKYTKDFLKMKGTLLENSTPHFNSNELIIFFKEIALNNLNKASFFYRMYNQNEVILSQGRPVTVDLPALTSTQKERAFQEDFNRILKSYRFFKGSEFSASFNNLIQRNPLGVIEIAFIEDIVKRFLKVYGDSKVSALGGYRLTQTQLEKMMLDYKELLEGEGIADPGRTRNTAETITLMTSLFQFQSNGDSDIEVNEMVEFAIELISAKQVAKVGHKFFQKQCPIVDDKGRYSPECYRENFELMLNESKNQIEIGDHLGKLKEYITDPSTNVSEYLEITEVFTRSCTHFDDGSDIPMSESELFLVLSGLMAVEQTVIRYDENHDNILQVSELEKAYPVYASAIRALLPDGLKYLAPKVFFYMIKEEKVPTPLTVMQLVVTPMSFLKADATRKTLTIVLKTLSLMSPANQDNPFPCEILR